MGIFEICSISYIVERYDIRRIQNYIRRELGS
jgi:hypothetical protein